MVLGVVLVLMKYLQLLHFINMASISRNKNKLNISSKDLKKAIVEKNNSLKRQNDAISSRIKDAEKLVKSKEKELKEADKSIESRLKEVDAYDKSLTKIKADIYSVEKESSKLNEVIKKLKGDESSYSNNIKKLESVKDELETKIAEYELRSERAVNLTDDIDSLQVRKSVAQSDLNKLLKSQTIAEDKIDDLDASFKDKVEELKDKQLELVKKYESFAGKVDIVEDEIKGIESDRDDKIKELEEDIGHKNAELTAVNSLINKAEDEYIAWEKKIKKAEGLLEIENRKVQTVKDAYERWRINRLEVEAKLKLKKKIDNIDKAGLMEILGNG